LLDADADRTDLELRLIKLLLKDRPRVHPFAGNGGSWRKADVPIVVKRELILAIADIERAFPSVFFVCSALGSIHTFKRVLNFLLPQ
jgi:hypothetical protein